MNSASAWLRPPATRTSSPSAYCGRILRARLRRSLSATGGPPATSGIPQAGHRRALGGCEPPQPGHTSDWPPISSRLDVQLDFLDAVAGGEPEGTHLRLGASHTDDHVDRPRPRLLIARGPERQVDVGLGGIGLAAGVGVVDRAQSLSGLLDLAHHT